LHPKHVTYGVKLNRTQGMTETWFKTTCGLSAAAQS